MMTYREDAKEDRSNLIVAAAGRVVALNAEDGSIVWKWENSTNSVFFVDYDPRIEVHKGMVYIAMKDTVVGLRYESGELVFETKIHDGRSRIPPTLMIEGGKLFVAMGMRVTALSLVGDTLWSIHGRSGDAAMTLAFPDKIRNADHTVVASA